ncbi:MAG: S26 family signal peptidase [Planctomycetia bacterium]|nr:S26 family signal peptidase [Planctomycetia bacterium]
MRSFLQVAVHVAVLLLAIRAFLIAPIVVPTSSMAPTLLGVHGDAVCPKCGRAIQWGADITSFDASRVECFRCGAEQTAFDERALVGGDRLLVDRSAYWLRGPRRWEMAVLRDPTSPDRWLVKRVVGLPGETISLRDGDLFNSDERVQKSLAQLRLIAIPLYDSTDISPNSDMSPFRGQDASSQWERHTRPGAESFLRLPAPQALTAETSPTFDWLVYHPPEMVKEDRGAGNAITDVLPYNQDVLRRPILVTDVLLTCRIRWQGAGAIAVRLPARRDGLLRLEPGQSRVELLVDGESRWNETVTFEGEYASAFPLTVAHCDGRVLLEIAGQSLSFDLDELAGASSPAANTPGGLAIGVQGVGVEITNLRLDRDIYYSEPPELAGAHWESLALGEGEYLLLGDNPAHSLDGRYWRPPAVSRNSFLGRPFLVHGASRAARVAGWAFQVPDLERIRYIPTARDE